MSVVIQSYMPASITKKYVSPKQEVNIIIKKDTTLTKSCAPTIKTAKEMRAKQLAMKFISDTENPELGNITLKDFAKTHKIGQAKLREQLKFLSGESMLNYNKNSNNIIKHNTTQNANTPNTLHSSPNTLKKTRVKKVTQAAGQSNTETEGAEFTDEYIKKLIN